MAIKRYNATIRNLEWRLRKFKDQLPITLERIVKSLEFEIVKMVSDEQLYEQGINGKGVEIMSYRPYARTTIMKKRRKGQPTDRVTLRDTGDFHAGFRLIFDADGFYISSYDYKTPYLVKRYGQEIFRLSDENFNRVVKMIRRDIIEYLKKEIHK